MFDLIMPQALSILTVDDFERWVAYYTKKDACRKFERSSRDEWTITGTDSNGIPFFARCITAPWVFESMLERLARFDEHMAIAIFRELGRGS